MSFYNPTSINPWPRTQFTFHAIYSNREEMRHTVEDVTTDNIGAEVYVPYNVYLLVDYNKNGSEHYASNQEEDLKVYGNDNFDLTVWQVREVDYKPKCFAVARLHSVLPTFEVCGQYRIDLLASISGGDYFGKGKNLFPLDADTNIPVPVEN